MTRSLLVTRPLPDTVLDAARSHFDLTVRGDTGPMTPAEVATALSEFDALLPTLGDPLGQEAFLGPIRTQILANFGVGYNHIDVAAARAAGIVVTNTPGAVTDATADIAMTLILMTCRRAGEGERLLRAGKWTGWHPTQLLGFHVTAKTLGIVGMGRIGKAIARRAHLGFGMKIVFHNRSPVAEPGVPATQLGSLREVMAAADVVVVAVPGGPGTRHLIDVDALSAMQPHGYFVNIARGDVVDEAALADALKEARIAGAGLDVYEREPSVTPALVELENVTLLPHLGTAALEVRTAMGLMAVDNLVAWAERRELPNPVAP
ncbi:MAG: D-glycerate dehydrogenase [Pseudomonadota bacterium]